jgi:predicted ABC-type ATPase
MLKRIEELLGDDEDFAFETTLATRSYIGTIAKAKQKGYEVTLLYFWLHSPEQAKKRVEERVSKGGHNIPDEVVERRYYRGIHNFFELYSPVCDNWLFIDNTNSEPMLIASNKVSGIEIINAILWNKIRERYEK